MSGKHRKRDNKGKIFINIIFFICIFIMIFSGIKIIKWFKENKDNEEIIGEIKNIVHINNNIETVDKYSIDFEWLKQKNSDTIAWIKVYGTNIEYPVVKTTNNDYYMNHSFDKSKNSAGWVFMDYKNKFDGTDKNMVIYAHNRVDGSLFGTLRNILSKEWQNNTENYIIPFITENEKAEYRVFSVYTIEMEDYYITTSFNDESSFQSFINTIKSRSIKDFNVDVTTENQILTLSTCASDSKHRVVLHAVKIN